MLAMEAPVSPEICSVGQAATAPGESTHCDRRPTFRNDAVPLRRLELFVLPALCLAAWYAFDIQDLDLYLMNLVHAQDPHHPWPMARMAWLRIVNDYFISTMSLMAVLIALALIVLDKLTVPDKHAAPRRLLRSIGLFLLISLLLGPGLLVNGLLKSQWGRPRPVDVTQYGGDYQYRHPLDPGRGGKRAAGGQGRSFPSGHAAAAFWTTALFFLVRHLRPRWACATLFTSIGFGLLIGTARILCGKHFPSDIVWAGILVFISNWTVFYLLLRFPQQLRQRAAQPARLPAALLPARTETPEGTAA